MEDAVTEVRKYQFIIPMTKEQKRKYEQKRKAEGKTSQGCLKSLFLQYIGESEHDERSNG